MESNKEKRRFNTFNGVFIQTTLSILGVILFLRTGWVTGNAGLYKALVILLFANLITLATALSISTIATNKNVGNGGIYYIISRSLGLSMGGAIGIPMYISQAISVAFYITGFSESLSWLFPHINTVLLSAIVILIFAIITFIGADLVVKFQLGIFIILMLSIISIFVTPHWIPLKVNLISHYAVKYNFWKVFAVFFPAATGITAGIGLSGELKNPQKSIPRGILYSILFTFVIYVLVMIKFSAIAPFKDLINSPLLILKTSFFPALIYLGIWAATLSSGLTFILTAPRTLQALANDGVIPRFFANNLGSKKDEPRLGVIITVIIALIFVLMGSLNFLATIITIFFLSTYAITNLAVGLRSLIALPTFRPTFKVPWWASFLGLLEAYLIMILISFTASLVATIIMLLIYYYLNSKELKQSWGDSRAGIWMSLIKTSLYKVENIPLNVDNWRANIMLFNKHPEENFFLSSFTKWLGQGEGIITIFKLIKGKIIKNRENIRIEHHKLKEFIDKNNLPFIPEIEVVDDIYNSIRIIVQAHGMGKLASNIAIFGLHFHENRLKKFFILMRDLILLKKNILLLKYNRETGFGNYQNIHIWWRGKGNNEGLMVVIARLLIQNPEWKNATIEIIKTINSADNIAEERSIIEKALRTRNFQGKISIIVNNNDAVKALKEHSSRADLIIMGMGVPQKFHIGSFIKNLRKIIPENKTTLIVRNNEIETFFTIEDEE